MCPCEYGSPEAPLAPRFACRRDAASPTADGRREPLVLYRRTVLETAWVFAEAVVIGNLRIGGVDDAVRFDVAVRFQRRVAVGGRALACAGAVGAAAEFRIAGLERVVVQFRVDIEFMTPGAGDIAAAIGRIARTEFARHARGWLDDVLRLFIGIQRAAHGDLLGLFMTRSKGSQGPFRRSRHAAHGTRSRHWLCLSHSPAQSAPHA